MPTISLLHKGALFLVALGGMITLATIVTGQAQTNSQQLTVRSVEATTPIDTNAPADSSTAAKEADTAPQPTSKSVSNNSTSAPSAQSQKTAVSTQQKTTATPPCDTIAATKAKLIYTQGSRIETARHNRVMIRLRSTGLVVGFLNPARYDMQLQQENDLHSTNVSQLSQVYHAALVTAHCD